MYLSYYKENTLFSKLFFPLKHFFYIILYLTIKRYISHKYWLLFIIFIINKLLIIRNSMLIKRYDQNSPISKEKASQLTTIFRENYPASHSEENKEDDIAQRNDYNYFNKYLQDGWVILTAEEINGKILGLIETKEVENTNVVFFQLAWIIVDNLARWQGVAKKLHDVFESESRERAKTIDKQFCLLLAVHPNNFAKQIYEALWYKQYGKTTSTGKEFMYKDI